MDPFAPQGIRLENSHSAPGEKFDDTLSLFPTELIEPASAPRVLHVTVASPRTDTERVVFETVQPEWLIVTDDRVSQFDKVSEPWALTLLRQAGARWPYRLDLLGWRTISAVLIISAAATLLLMRGPHRTTSQQAASQSSVSQQVAAQQNASDVQPPREVNSISEVVPSVTAMAYAPPSVPTLQSSSYAPPETTIDSPPPSRVEVRKTELPNAAPVPPAAAAAQRPPARVQRNSVASASTASKPRGSTSSQFQGRLIVDSNPQGATVLINQRAVGVTPLDLPRYRAASYAVWVEREGYARWSAAVLVPADKVTRLKAQLEKRQ